MNNLKFVIPLRNASDSAIFNATAGVNVEVNKGKNKGLTGSEFAITLAVSFVASAAYDSLKAIAQKITSDAWDYFHTPNQKFDNTKINFNGTWYPINSEGDLKILMGTIEAAIKSGLEIEK
ncbi:MAG: hypothetical protein IPH79_10880 [Sphingomonadales bacterium]|nr:hypothetical protein [Sphingomonadales bacterium]MBK9589345.1 hypothetical protein [Sphingomonadales bacterium]